MVSQGARYWQKTRKSIRAGAYDIWGDTEGNRLVDPGKEEARWGVEDETAACHELQEVVERMQQNSQETCTAKGQEVAVRSSNKRNASCLCGKRSDRVCGKALKEVLMRQLPLRQMHC